MRCSISAGDRAGVLRVLRASKNRFGSTEEIGVFELGEGGLAEVDDPARAFLVEHEGPAPGSVVAATMEGSRPLLVEVQALVAPAGYGTAARRVSGMDANRLALIVAVLGRKAGDRRSVRTTSTPIWREASRWPSLALTCHSRSPWPVRSGTSPVRPGTVAVGEIGLLGELRAVAGVDRRLREAARLGFTSAIVPSNAGVRRRTSRASGSTASRRCATRSRSPLDPPPSPPERSGPRPEVRTARR